MSTPVREQLAHLSWRLCEEGRFCDADLINATLDGLTQFAGEGASTREGEEGDDRVGNSDHVAVATPSPVPLVERLRLGAVSVKRQCTHYDGDGSCCGWRKIAADMTEAADRIEELEAIKVEQAARIWDLEDATWASNVDSDPTDPRLIPLPGGRVAAAAQDLRVGDVVAGLEVQTTTDGGRGLTNYDDPSSNQDVWLSLHHTLPGTLVLLDKAAAS